MKLPRNLSGEKLIAHLLKHWDYVRVHQVGSHVILQTGEPSHHRIAIPAHTPLTQLPQLWSGIKFFKWVFDCGCASVCGEVLCLRIVICDGRLERPEVACSEDQGCCKSAPPE